MHLARDLELHVTFEHDHDFVRGVGKVFPPLSG
jgi:hypothetical protein